MGKTAVAITRAERAGLTLLALAPVPNGDILVNDDYNDRVSRDRSPVTNRIVWQYGHTGVAGTRPATSTTRTAWT